MRGRTHIVKTNLGDFGLVYGYYKKPCKVLYQLNNSHLKKDSSWPWLITPHGTFSIPDLPSNHVNQWKLDFEIYRGVGCPHKRLSRKKLLEWETNLIIELKDNIQIPTFVLDKWFGEEKVLVVTSQGETNGILQG